MTESLAAVAAASPNEWQPGPDPAPRLGDRLLIVAVLGAAPVLLALAGAVASAHVLWIVAGAIAGAEAGWVYVQVRSTAGEAAPATDERHARLIHIAHGLASDLGMEPPRLLVSRQPGCNAAVGSSGIVVTDELASTYARTELEATLAHCLVRVQRGGIAWACASAAVGGIGARAAPFVGEEVDARAAAVTRYPPALASAIEKATPATGRASGVWFVADGKAHLPAPQRIAALLDL